VLQTLLVHSFFTKVFKSSLRESGFAEVAETSPWLSGKARDVLWAVISSRNKAMTLYRCKYQLNSHLVNIQHQNNENINLVFIMTATQWNVPG